MCLTFTQSAWLLAVTKNSHKNSRHFHTFAPFGQKLKMKANNQPVQQQTSQPTSTQIYSSEYLWATKVAFVLCILLFKMASDCYTLSSVPVNGQEGIGSLCENVCNWQRKASPLNINSLDNLAMSVCPSIWSISETSIRAKVVQRRSF